MRGSVLRRAVAFGFALLAACTASTTPGGAHNDAAPPSGGAANGPDGAPTGDLAPGPIITPPASTKPADAAVEAGGAEAGSPVRDAAGEDDGSVQLDARVVCGDGRVDAGEACDPGKDPCCNATCRGPRSAGATCRASGGACDLAEVCDGTNVACPSDAKEAPGHVCRAASDACDVAETCDGTVDVCPDDAVAPDTFKCGTAGSDECDADDFCDGSTKACPDLVQPSSAPCGGSPTGQCDAQDHCAGTGTACVPEFAPATTTPCGSSVDTECDNPDTCDGAGNCIANYEPSTANCGDQGIDCRNDDKCDGAGSCTDNGVKNMGTTCGSGTDTECDNPDTCDASGNCLPNFEALHASCGDTPRDCYVDDECDGNGACTNNGPEPMGTPCGSSSDTECDNPDTCDASGACLPNHEPTTVDCGDKGVDCRNDDKCRGDGTCEDKGFASEFTPCGVATPEDPECDKPDSCDPNGVCQPRNEPTTTACGDKGVECHADDMCKGDGTCEDKGFLDPGTACGAGGTSECDSPDSCDAIGFCQPRAVQDGDPCGDQGIDCNFDDMCMGGSCMDAGFWTLDTACGSTDDTECDNPDKCNASGACLVNHEAADTNCGDRGVECHNDDKCDGAGACQDKGVVAVDTPCGSSSDTQCDNPDKCDASGVCLTNHEPALAPCGDQGVACTFNDACDGNGACSDNGFRSPGAPCGSGANTQCDNPDTCNGAGACLTNYEPMSTTCGVPGVACLNDDKCDGAGLCADQGVQPMGSPCGSASDTDCDNPDSCNASGSCLGNLEPPATQCTDASPTNCQDAQCDGAGVCNQSQGVEFEFTACGNPDATDCDAADSCNAAGVCVDRIDPAATVCRADAGECDVADTCNGSSKSCPNVFEPMTTVCADTDDTDCTDARCNGAGACNQAAVNEVNGRGCADTMPADCKLALCNAGTCDQAAQNKTNGASCGDPSDTQCDNPDTCNGGTCRVNHEPNNTACGSASNTDCDNPDSCDGNGACNVRNEPAGFACPDTTPSNCKDARCDGAATCDQNYTNEVMGTACGNSSMTACTFADTCDAGGTCQANDAPDGTICRAGTGTCNPQETCSGGVCPMDAFAPGGTPCGSATDDTCTDPDLCDGSGTCQPNHASNSTVCRTDAGDCDVAENCNNGVCPANGFDPPGTACGSSSDTACDNPDTCNASGGCLANNEPGTTVCRSVGGACDLAENCDGAGGCPVDAFKSMGTECRADAGDCDLAETCPGGSPTCPPNAYEAPGTTCTDPTPGDCKDAQCDGAGVCDPSRGNETAGTPCTDTMPSDCSAAQCDGSGVCDQARAPEAPGTPCGNFDDCRKEECDAMAVPTCMPVGDESDGHACYVGGVASPDPTNGKCSTGTCCPGATTNQGPTTCGFPGEDNVVFVTSQPVIPGMLGGIPGARQFCQTLAAGANMGGTWQPWLSDSFFDVYFQISDGPYRRVDGATVARDKTDLTDGYLMDPPGPPMAGSVPIPIEIVELNLVSTNPITVTGTFPNGTRTPNNCGDWNAPIASPFADGGFNSASDPTWTFLGSPLDCMMPATLYCFRDDCPGIPDVDFQNDPYNCGGCGNVCNDGNGTCAFGRCAGRVFVTSIAYKGNLGGLGGADTICDMHAQAANLPGTYAAWLSQVDQAGVPTHAYSRVLDQPYYLVDGSPVAGSVMHLRSADTMPLANAINLDETGAPSTATEAWTGSLGDGASVPEPSGDCQEWTSSLSGDSSVKGNPQSTSDTWSYDVGAGYSCDIARPLYCFQVLAR